MPAGLSADIDNEFGVLDREAALLAEALPSLQSGKLREGKGLRWGEIAGVAAAVEQNYSGCERVLLLIAKHVDGAPIEKADAWRASLLNRMASPPAEVRPAVLSQECKLTLDRFRSFRHRVRNSYGVDLDETVVLERAAKILATLEVFHLESGAFLESWTIEN